MVSREERLERYDNLKYRIEELNVMIAEHERNKKHNYGFYAKGAELYKELAQIKTELAITKRYL